MRTARIIFAFLLAAAGLAAPPRGSAKGTQAGERVADRIVARIEGDIITLSDVRELGAFQQLVEGKSESDDQLLSELIEQWVVNTEASATHFPKPPQTEVDRELARLQGQFKPPQSYAQRIAALGLSAEDVRDMLARQIYLERYMDYKFRPTVQIDSAEVDKYYREELVPELAKKGQPAPGESGVEALIREVLVQRAITKQAAQWLDETKSHLKLVIVPAGGAK